MSKEDEIKGQFRRIAKMFTEIEAMVVARGKVNSTEFEELVAKWQLTQTGIDYLGGLVRQSPLIQIQEEGDEAWLVFAPRADDVVRGMAPIWGEWRGVG